jgi:hypothetical protein
MPAIIGPWATNYVFHRLDQQVYTVLLGNHSHIAHEISKGSSDPFRTRFDQIIDLKHRQRQGQCALRVRGEGYLTIGVLPAVSSCWTRRRFG